MQNHLNFKQFLLAPIDPDPSIWEDGSITPVDVYVLQTVLAIDSISPGTSEFTATTRTTYYYTPEHCNQTVAQQYACDTTLSNGNGLKFFASSLAKSLPERRLFLSQENVHATKFEKDGKNLTLNAEQVETRGTYFKNYDMRYFPWEIHVLEIPLTSLYTSNIVNVVQFPGNVESYGSPVVPNGTCINDFKLLVPHIIDWSMCSHRMGIHSNLL